MSGGRPTDYTQDIADRICERLADGESLRAICAEEDMPNKATVFRWLGRHQEFSDQYARARETQADTLFDEVLDIADDGTNDWMRRNGEDDAGWQANGEHIQRSRLRIDARKWMAGKMRPKVYGEKTVIGGDDSMDPIKTKETGEGVARLAAMIQGIAERTREAGDPAGE